MGVAANTLGPVVAVGAVESEVSSMESQTASGLQARVLEFSHAPQTEMGPK